MSNIKNILKSFTFRFKDCIYLLDRNIISSIIYIGVLVLILSCFYHFNYIESLSMYDYLVNIFVKEYVAEYIVSLLFINILCWNIYIISKPILTKNKYSIKFKNIFNMYCHIFSILFILDLFFIFIFKETKLTDKMEFIYAWSSIIIAMIFTILYPLLFLRYLSQNNIEIVSHSNCKIINYFKPLKIISLINIYKKNISNILLLEYDFYMHTLRKKSFYKCFIYYILMSFIYTLLKLKFNPNIINYDYDFTLKAYSIIEIFTQYYLDILFFIITVIFISLIYWSYIKIKHSHNSNFLYILKVSIFSLYVAIFLSLGDILQRKIINFSTISPSILPSQSLATMISLLTYVTILYIIFFFIKDILMQSYKVKKYK